jgi:hypothetical protein
MQEAPVNPTLLADQHQACHPCPDVYKFTQFKGMGMTQERHHRPMTPHGAPFANEDAIILRLETCALCQAERSVQSTCRGLVSDVA